MQSLTIRAHRVRSLGYCLVILLIICCSMTNPKPTPEPRPPIIQQFLTDPTCKPPCWETITPGETDIFDAADILSNTPGIILDHGPRDQTGRGKEICWSFDETDGVGRAEATTQSDSISRIWLYFGSEQNVTVEEIIAYYGEPNYVLVRTCYSIFLSPTKCTIHLIYEMGMALAYVGIARGRMNNSRIDVLTDTQIDSILLYPAGIQGYLDTFVGNQPNVVNELIPWRGYGEYP